MKLQTLYAFKGAFTKGDPYKGIRGVILWDSKGRRVAIFNGETCTLPRRNLETITINCFKYKLRWLADDEFINSKGEIETFRDSNAKLRNYTV